MRIFEVFDNLPSCLSVIVRIFRSQYWLDLTPKTHWDRNILVDPVSERQNRRTLLHPLSVDSQNGKDPKSVRS